MLFRLSSIRTAWRSYPVRLCFFSLLWFVIITAAHYYLNTDREERPVLKMGYMPVITNLAAPILDAASADTSSEIRFKAVKFASFAEMAEALRNREIDAAFIIAPLSIVLHQQGADVRVVYIGNRHESTLVVRKGLGASSLTDLMGRTVAVPMRYSGHNIALLKMAAELGIQNKINIVEMNPPDMASALASGSLDAYFVGEPFAAQTLKDGTSELLFFVEKVWPDFICNLLLVTQRYVDAHPDRVQLLVEGAARSGIWAQANITQAAQIASNYWGQPVDLVQYALTNPKNRIVFNRFLPAESELEKMAKVMVEFGLVENDNIDGLVLDQFAKIADLTQLSDLSSVIRADVQN